MRSGSARDLGAKGGEEAGGTEPPMQCMSAGCRFYDDLMIASTFHKQLSVHHPFRTSERNK